MNNDLIINVLYVLVWSLGLMFATFPNLISGEMKFDFQNNLNNDAVMKYIFPFIMAMAIYLIDVLYVSMAEERSGNYKGVTLSWALLGGFLLFFVFSLLGGFILFFVFSLLGGKCLFFVLGWLCLTALKFIKTDTLPPAVYPTVSIVVE